MPFDRAAEPGGVGFDRSTLVAGVEHQGLDVFPQVDDAVHVGWYSPSSAIRRRIGTPDASRSG
jgi:hypothetical protein